MPQTSNKFLLSGLNIDTTAANLVRADHFKSMKGQGAQEHSTRKRRQVSFDVPRGGIRVNDPIFGIPSQSGVTTSASALGSSGQIGIFNSLGGINSGRLNEEDLQNSVHSEFGQDMISQILNDQSHKPRGPSTVIDETVELEADAVQELVAQEIIIKHRNVTQIVASPVSGLLQGQLLIKIIQLDVLSSINISD